jgi:hypothetical protein
MLSRYHQTGKFSRNRLVLFKRVVLEMSEIAHLGYAERAKSLIETLSMLYSRLWQAQTTEGATLQAVLGFIQMLDKLIGRLTENSNGGLLDGHRNEQALEWIQVLRQAQVDFSRLVSIYETDQSPETRMRDMRSFQVLFEDLDPLKQASESLLVKATADDTMRALSNVITNL